MILSVILIGFRYQGIPDYKAGQIADQDVRAIQDFTYEDTAATALKRAEAESVIPALYQLESEIITEKEKSISAGFSIARDILTDNSITRKTELTPALERELLDELSGRIGRNFPAKMIPVLLRQRFNPDFESRILRILGRVLRDGIIDDRSKFLLDRRTGILIRDSSFPFEHPLADANLVRDLAGAREYLRQFRLDFSDLSQHDLIVIIQYLENALFPTLLSHSQETESRRSRASLRIPPVEVQIRQGQMIIRSGEQVTQNVLLQLKALRNLRRPRSLILQFSAYFLLSLILVYSLWRYLVFYQSRHRKIRNHMVLILVIVASELLTMRLATELADILGERFQRFHDPLILYYGIPFAFGALLTTLLVDVNLGIIASIILAVLTGLFYGEVNLSAYLIIGSLAGIYSVRQYKDRAAILKAGLTIGIVNILCLIGLDILQQTPLHFADALDQTALALLSGILAAALASSMLPALETIFKIATDVRLLELSNLNAPILRRLAVEAPGTYHHSLMTATLAESAAESIGANPLLVRVAAYYHDIGKIMKPEYFVENQSYGSNKHEEIPPSSSYEIISSHIQEGLQLAQEVRLPQIISDMIPQHHGTRVMTYFYQKAKDGDGETGVIVEQDFRYPGPKPQSKESAIMMMADSVEAASRTLSDPSPAQIEGMVGRLVDGMVGDNQFDECDITLKEVHQVKKSLAKIVMGIFHHRIDYPGYDFSKNSNESKDATVRNSDSEQTKAL
jgi:cyclic-di-AMP phosphodiesterase PgpH